MSLVLMCPKEAAAKLGVSIKTLLGHVRDGSLRYVNISRGDKRPRYAFAESDLDEFEQARRWRNENVQGAPWRSTGPKKVRTTNSISNAEVIAFTARPSAGRGVRRKR
jgi:Helix-turn-helix domain